MPRYARLVSGQPQFIYGEFATGSGSATVNHPYAWLADATSDDLAAIGVGEVIEADPPEEGQQIATETLVHAGGVFSIDATYEDIPAPPNPTSITAYQAGQELISNGGTVAAMQALVDGSGDEELKVWWSKATIFVRDDENVEKLRVLLAATLEEFETQDGMDAFFLAASAW